MNRSILHGSIAFFVTLGLFLFIALAILPGGLSRILGTTTHLNIPTDMPVYLMVAGLGLAGIGFLTRRLHAVRTGTGIAEHAPPQQL